MAQTKKLSIKPLGDRVVVSVSEKGQEKKLPSGIIIPESAEKNDTLRGEVVAVGEGEYKDGKRIPMQIKIGDSVLFTEYSANKIKIEGEEYFLIQESSVLAITK
jgi:chaperonin GroES